MNWLVPIQEGVFAPELVHAMSSAIDTVCTELSRRGCVPVREVIATRVLRLARYGEHDSKTLALAVLSTAKAAH